MAEESLQKITGQEYPIVAVGPLIYKENGEVLLTRGPKFGEYWTIPGGKVALGENVEDTVRRETKEEIDVELGAVEFVQYQDAINPPAYHVPKHFIFMDFFAAYKSGEPKTSEEISEFAWFKAEEALQKLKLAPDIINLLRKYISWRTKNSGESEDYKARYQRAIADYQNLQKEVAARRSEWAVMSEQQILEEFIPVYDNFKKAYLHKPEIGGEEATKFKQWADGIGFIQKQFGDILKAHKVEAIKTAGELFDPAKHEAAGEEARDGVAPGTILREVDGGYMLGNKVIKVARVIVAQ